MSDIKKFLDYEGVQHLWSKINMNDYPNNETLINVINAIDETKADRSELVQSDWNQNDETAVDFIKNRPFYDIKVSSIICDGQIDFSRTHDWDGLYGSYSCEQVYFEEGHIYNAIFNNENNEFVCQEAVCEQDGHLTLYVQDSDFYVEIFSYDSIYIFSTNPEYFDYDIFGEGVYNLKTAEIGTTPKTLDEKFIPDTIARIEDIPQSDWNQSDENAVDFIKNKPFYDIKVSSIIYDDLVDFTGSYDWIDYLQGELYEEVSCKKGHIYNAIFNNENNEFVCQEVVCEQDGYLTMPVQDYDYYVEIVDGYNISIHTNSDYFDYDIFGECAYNFKIAEIETTPKTLDEKFIPDTIARIEDIPVTSVNGQTGDVQINIPEQVQSDWNQTDESAVDFIKNRTHYEKEEMITRTCSFEYENIDSYEKITRGHFLYFKISDDVYSRTTDVTLFVNLDGEEYSAPVSTCTDTAKYRSCRLMNGSTFIGTCYIIYADAVTISYVNFTKGIWFQTGSPYLTRDRIYAHVTESYSVTTIKLLDEKFIPDTIARVEDIPEINYPVTSVNGQTGDVQINIPEQVQSDWNQTDESATNYIKNKPILATSEEIKALFN